MFLSQLAEKEIFVGNTPRAIIKGVGVSLKTYKIKYLLCAETTASRALFALSINGITSFNMPILLPRLRPVLAKHCACVFLGLPVYSFDGEYLGNIQDLAIDNQAATLLYTDKEITLPISSVAACSDALLLKKEQPYPLGQRIPAPFVPALSEKYGGIVTKPVLRAALEKNSLIKLTLSLPPFDLNSL